jgi:hypothetical protein
MNTARWWTVVVLYGLLNAIAYSCLLPLWEGWDEGFHYGYAQYLSVHRSFPVLLEARLSREIWRAYELAPVSHYLQGYTKAPLNFSDYQRLPESERQHLRQELYSIPTSLANEPHPDKIDYEVNQSPLPYLLMAPVNLALSSRPLPERVLFLRLLCSTIAVLLLAHATRRLAQELALEASYALAALFCIFSAQMLFAVFCHVCNDCFAVPAAAYLILATIRAWNRGTPRAWGMAGIAATVAVLVKAYLLFMAAMPLAALAVALGRKKSGARATAAFLLPLVVFAAPWYVRNLVLYANLTGTSDSTSNLTPRMLIEGALRMPWLQGIAYMAHGGLWTGNNSFTSFSANTLNLMLAAIAAGAVLWMLRARRNSPESCVAVAIVLHSLGLAVTTVAYFVSTHGALIGTWPWYSQVLVAPVMLMVFLGLSRFQAAGRAGLIVCPLLWGYVMFSTYFVKLIPQYGGYAGKGNLSPLWNWYLDSAAQRDSLLSTTCLRGPAVLWPVLTATSILGLGIVTKLIYSAFGTFGRCTRPPHSNSATLGG